MLPWIAFAFIGIITTFTTATNDRPFDVLWPSWDGVSEVSWETDYVREMFPSPVFAHVNHSETPAVVLCSGEINAIFCAEK